MLEGVKTCVFVSLITSLGANGNQMDFGMGGTARKGWGGQSNLMGNKKARGIVINDQ